MRIAHAAFAALALLAIVPAGAAEKYPTRPVRMIVPFPPGGGTDILTRVVGQKLSEGFVQQVVVDNRPGAGGTIGSRIAADAPADGYTLIMANAGSHAVNASLYSKLPYDPVKDFAPITLVSSAPNILIVHPSLPVKSVKDLIALAKAKPGQLAFGSGGNGSTAHLSGEMFKTMADIDIVHVPFKGSPSAVLAVISGQIAMAMPNIPPALPHVKTGKLKALAVTTAKRSAAVPELPTVAESGLSGYEATAWFGVLAPAGTPRDIIEKLNALIVKSLRAPDMQQRLQADGAEAAGGTPEAFAAVIKRDIAKWAVVVKKSGARAD
jgi:tripartite-type tricarboxylate transporter receptor subunit TctC